MIGGPSWLRSRGKGAMSWVVQVGCVDTAMALLLGCGAWWRSHAAAKGLEFALYKGCDFLG